MFKLIILALIFTSSSLWAQDYDINACIEDKKSIYQCIDEFVTKNLPDTDWCTIVPVDKTDKKQGLFVITIKLTSQGSTFSQEAHFLKAGTNGKLVSRANGSWVLKNRTIKVTYDSSTTIHTKVKFPTSVKIDFKDLTGSKLVLYSHSNNSDKSLNFGPITFQRCNRLIDSL